ncbi:MAG: bifunctional 23S rRNA (guanine(2069)-N(7))-methyltransferase RlmK/23S rRNA (guanine(2445)-N(2))-methyltransferase RlmL [Proteobacteria bacterium]|nr:bifunctional 23S rRNA (guanine(2069)-N(7))-methyltransferase RlmK/23S rRNA (guanine(2445)-N(2))-methyltransferase RlmL [Pseudomonadota bacterium]
MTTETLQRFVATVPKGFADLLALELATLGATDIRERAGGVTFWGPLAIGYRACLESRLASRVLLQVGNASMTDAQSLYDAVRTVDWREHLDIGGTLACEYTGSHPAITNSYFGTLKVKDAICDQFRDTTGGRPDVQTERPSLRVHAHAAGNQVTLSIDLAGESLSRRGYRIAGGEAPLRENLAAGILMRAGWPKIAEAGGEFLDPMCGSGTFVIEAAWMAANIAPGLMRDFFGFLGWRGHDAGLWNKLRDDAMERMHQQVPVIIRGTDRSSAAIATAAANARRAGVGRDILFEQVELAKVRPSRVDAADVSFGLLCVNPPYGQRIGQGEDAIEAHRDIGVALRERFVGWHAAVLTGEPALGQLIGINAHRVHTVFNGAIECRLLRFAPGERRARREATAGIIIDDATIAQSNGARMFANRLTKNLQHLGKQARRQGVSCWRLYDADMPEYALAVDLYVGTGSEAEQRWLFVQEYAPPDTVDPEAARRRREEALSVMPEVTGVAFADIHLRVRRKQKGASQYDKLGARGRQHVVEEDGLQLLVNFDDYLDTGLFLDHRLTRQRVRAASAGQRVLNLFCYTGSVSVHAAAGGALSTTSVDLSRTYLDWAARNLEINGFAQQQHHLLQADCMAWLAAEAPQGPAWDLIFLDPPTFSNSARMQGVLDVQRDHVRLVDDCMQLLAPGGLLLFSNNAQRFQLDAGLAERYLVTDVSAATIPFDFQGNPRIHRCFEVRHRPVGNG